MFSCPKKIKSEHVLLSRNQHVNCMNNGSCRNSVLVLGLKTVEWQCLKFRAVCVLGLVSVKYSMVEIENCVLGLVLWGV